MEVTSQYQNILIRFYGKKNEDLKELASELQNKDKEVIDESKEVTSELAVLQCQISDSKLDQFIEAAKRIRWEVGFKALDVRKLLDSPQGSDRDSLRNAIEEYDSNSDNLRGQLLRINKRIEELLSGEPSD